MADRRWRITLTLIAASAMVAAATGCNETGDPPATETATGPALESVIAMGESGDRVHVERLIELLEKDATDPQIRMEAIYALARIGDGRAVEPLIEVLERDMKVRKGYAMAAIPALGMLGDPRATAPLRAALNNRDEFWLGREMAASALGTIGSREAVPDLMRAAWLADTRDEAIVALARIGDPRGVEILFSALVDEQEEDTTQYALRGLVDIGGPAVAFIRSQAERDFADYPEKPYRDAATRVLEQIDSDEARTLLLTLAPATE